MLCQFLLYNKVNQLYIYIYSHISSLLRLPPTLPIPPPRWPQSIELISLCYAAASHQLSILHLVVYTCPCHSLTSSQLTLPPPRVLKSILYVCIFIPVLPLGSSEPFFFFLDSIYMCYVLLSLPGMLIPSLSLDEFLTTFFKTSSNVTSLVKPSGILTETSNAIPLYVYHFLHLYL